MGRGYNFATCMEGALVSSQDAKICFFVIDVTVNNSFILAESERIDLYAQRRNYGW